MEIGPRWEKIEASPNIIQVPNIPNEPNLPNLPNLPDIPDNYQEPTLPLPNDDTNDISIIPTIETPKETTLPTTGIKNINLYLLTYIIGGLVFILISKIKDQKDR